MGDCATLATLPMPTPRHCMRQGLSEISTGRQGATAIPISKEPHNAALAVESRHWHRVPATSSYRHAPPDTTICHWPSPAPYQSQPPQEAQLAVRSASLPSPNQSTDRRPPLGPPTVGPANHARAIPRQPITSGSSCRQPAAAAASNRRPRVCVCVCI